MGAAASDAGMSGAVVFEVVWRLVRTTGRRLAEELAADGFTDLRPAHCALLYRLSQKPARVSNLAQRGVVTRQAVSLLVDQLHGGGYVQREEDPADRRARIVVLTERGRAAGDCVSRSLARLSQVWEEAVGLDRIQQCATTLEELLAVVLKDAPATW